MLPIAQNIQDSEHSQVVYLDLQHHQAVLDIVLCKAYLYKDKLLSATNSIDTHESISEFFDKLNQYENIKEKILVTNDAVYWKKEQGQFEFVKDEDKDKESVVKIMNETFTTVFYNRIENYEPSELYDYSTKEIDLDDIVRNYQPLKGKKFECDWTPSIKIKSLDLRNYKQLERIVLGESNRKLYIEGLSNIKELGKSCFFHIHLLHICLLLFDFILHLYISIVKQDY